MIKYYQRPGRIFLYGLLTGSHNQYRVHREQLCKYASISPWMISYQVRTSSDIGSIYVFFGPCRCTAVVYDRIEFRVQTRDFLTNIIKIPKIPSVRRNVDNTSSCRSRRTSTRCKALSSAGGIRCPLRSLRKKKKKSYMERTEVLD